MSRALSPIIPIKGVIKNYPWGSFTILANHRGEVQSALPEAELWFGDNPAGPSEVEGEVFSLNMITKDYDGLPFLAKILAVEHSLSLQVHPALGDIPLLAHVLKDENHKPELVVALTEFHALVGFAAINSILTLLEKLKSEKASALIATPLRNGGSLVEVLDEILGMEDNEGVLDEVAAKLGNLDHVRAKWLKELIELYQPKLDPLAFLLCELIVLEPGSSIYVPPRCVHAYLHGTVVEVMANSDNVIRGGLTNKPIDKKNFLNLIDTRSDLAQRVVPRSENGALHWRPPVEDFTLMRIAGEFAQRLSIGTFAIAFMSEGSCAITTESHRGNRVPVSQNHGAFLAPGDYVVEGSGSLWVVSGKGR